MKVKRERFKYSIIIISILVMARATILVTDRLKIDNENLLAPIIIGLNSLFILYDGKVEKNEKMIVLAGYFIRLIMLISAALFDFIPFCLCSDDIMFYSTALEYHNGIFGQYHTNYEHVINFFMNIFGIGRIIPQYINILAWYLGWKILYHNFFPHLEKAKREMVTLFYCFMPINFFMTTELIRESIMMFMLMLSFAFLSSWMGSGKTRDFIIAIGIAVFSMWWHTVNIAMVGGCLTAFIFWNPRNRKWGIYTQKLMAVLIAIGVILIIFHSKFYTAMGYLPAEISIKTIANRPFMVGGSDYLVGIQVETLGQFIIWTIIRALYFWGAPVFLNWRSFMDVTAVLLDVFPFLMIFLLTLKNTNKEKKYYVGYIILIMFTFIYAWGTSNAGTAMRHRNMLLGVILMTYCIKSKEQEELKK